MFKDYLCHIGNTITRAYQRPFDKEWDNLLNKILNEGDLLSVGKHTVTFWFNGNTYEVWLANRWFSFAHLYQFNEAYLDDSLQFRPRFSTMRRLHKRTNQLMRDNKNKEHLQRKEIYSPDSYAAMDSIATQKPEQ